MVRIAACAVVVGLVGVAGLLGGCDTVKAPYSPGADPVGVANYPKITCDGRLEPFLVVGGVNVQKEPVLTVSTQVRLMSDKREWAKVQYRYIFMDANGMPMRGQPDWMPVTMEPRQYVFMTGNALDSTAADWRLEIRPQR